MITLNQHQIGKGWREARNGEQLYFMFQYLDYKSGHWKACALYKSDRVYTDGRVNYRYPVSYWAKIKAFFGGLKALYQRRVEENKEVS